MTIKGNAIHLGTPPLQASAIIGGLTNSLTAAGSTQAGATQLQLTSNSVFTTVAAGTGAILPPGISTITDKLAAGDWIRVINYGANALLVYPPTGGAISNGSVNAGFSVAANKNAEFVCIDGTNFFATLSA